MHDTPFHDAATFRGAFADGLELLLDQPGLGLFILGAANAGMDEALAARLRPRLEALFEGHRNRLAELFASGHASDDTDDDLLVFLKLASIGIEALNPATHRRAGPWEVQFNHLRAFRPKRIAGGALRGIRAPFDESGFHFNKPFLRHEQLWSGELLERPVALFYNKFPFSDHHGLLVPEQDACLAQFLDEGHHRYLWEACEALGERLPGVGFGYNAYGAHATVNQLHFHMFVRDTPLPLLERRWRHNGGDAPYPATCRVFDAARDAWGYIRELHAREQPYNLLYTPGRIHCLPRRAQGTYPLPEWSAGFAWHEMAGGIITFNRGEYEGLTEGEIAAALAGATAPE